jgi:hypothetical protein
MYRGVKRGNQNREGTMATERYSVGSETYCDIANDEAGRVCDMIAGEQGTDDDYVEDVAQKLYDRWWVAGTPWITDWPHRGTEAEIREFVRQRLIPKLRANADA